MSDDRDPIDRMLGMFEDRNDVLVSTPRVIHTISTPWTGHATTFIVQTFHEKDNGAYLYVQSISAKGGERHLFPPDVHAAIIGQHEYVKVKRREQAAQQAADTRKARGIVPGFLKGKNAKYGHLASCLHEDGRWFCAADCPSHVVVDVEAEQLERAAVAAGKHLDAVLVPVTDVQRRKPAKRRKARKSRKRR